MEQSGEMTFAQRMMQKMGWSEGKGLGKDEAGMKDFIKPKMKFNTKGIGFMGVDNKWVEHQEHFDDLLSSLNKGEKPDQQKDIACLTSASKLRGRTKFYAKMMRGKDLSNRSSQDLSAIIVPLAKKESEEKSETSLLPSERDGKLKSSQQSMNDYFAQMMSKRKSKSSQETQPENVQGEEKLSDSSPTESIESYKKEKKKKRKQLTEESTENITEDAEESKLSTTQSKKSKRSRKEMVEEVTSIDEKKTKKNKKSNIDSDRQIDIESDNSRETKIDDKNKKKKSKQVSEDETECSVEEKKLSKKKPKKEKTKNEAETNGDEESNEPILHMNVDIELLKQIRGKKLKRSKASAFRGLLSDEQLQEVYRLWTSGEYCEFMRRVHSGELPRWMAVEKSLVDRMVEGRTKMIDLADIREVLESKWKGDNSHEIWGYTNLPYLVE